MKKRYQIDKQRAVQQFRLLADGRWIFFRGEGGIYRISPSGGTPEHLTRGGSASEESSDGRWLYFSGEVADVGALERIPPAGGKPEIVVPGVAGRNFVLPDTGIWYFTPNTGMVVCSSFMTSRPGQHARNTTRAALSSPE